MRYAGGWVYNAQKNTRAEIKHLEYSDPTKPSRVDLRADFASIQHLIVSFSCQLRL